MTGKNSADIRLCVDAIDLCYSKEHIDTFVIVSGDSDFSPLVSKLKENGKRVIGLGMKESSSNLLIDNCDEFIYYEDLERPLGTPPRIEQDLPEKKREAFQLLVDSVVALVRENKEVLWSSIVKETMKRKKPSFNESYHGYRTFSDLLEDAEKERIIQLRTDARSGTYVIIGFGKEQRKSDTGELKEPKELKERKTPKPRWHPRQRKPKTKTQATTPQTSEVPNASETEPMYNIPSPSGAKVGLWTAAPLFRKVGTTRNRGGLGGYGFLISFLVFFLLGPLSKTSFAQRDLGIPVKEAMIWGTHVGPGKTGKHDTIYLSFGQYNAPLFSSASILIQVRPGNSMGPSPRKWVHGDLQWIKRIGSTLGAIIMLTSFASTPKLRNGKILDSLEGNPNLSSVRSPRHPMERSGVEPSHLQNFSIMIRRQG